MIYKVVDLVITVDQCASISRLVFLFAKKLHYIFIVRSLAYWDRGLDIDRLRLRGRDGAEGLDLAIIEARRLAKAREADRGRRDEVKLRKRHNGILPPVDGEYGRNKNGRVAHIWFLSSILTPGNDASSNMRPSRNSMM